MSAETQAERDQRLSETLRTAKPVRWLRGESDAMSFDETEGWGVAVGYMELSADGYVRRIVWAYENGNLLQYGPDRLEDEFGKWPDQPIGDDAEQSGELVAIDRAEFEHAWSRGRVVRSSG